MKLPSKIKFSNYKIKESFENLISGTYEEKELYENIIKAFRNIENNSFSGIQIPKRQIPKEYKVKNLWKYNLPKGWRLLYSIESDSIVVISIILDWLDHKNYEKKFSY